MSKLVFEASDFEPGKGNPLTSTRLSAYKAQAIHDKWLASGTVVYGCYEGDGNFACDTKVRNEFTTHTARLVDVQEIVKAEPECEHSIDAQLLANMGVYECRLCHKKLKAPSLETVDE